MYNFDIDIKEAVYDLSRSTGISVRLVRNEFSFERCPYCNQKSDPKQRKFAVNSKTGQFQCFRASCGAKGNVLTLAKDFNLDLGNTANEYYGIGNQRHYKYTPLKEPIESKDAAIEYMKGRGISEEVCRKYQITTDEHDNIVFPFIDENNILQYVKYRNPAPKEGQNKEWSAKDRKPILFGMYQCSLTNKTLIITEGQIDSLSVIEAGFENAVSVPTGALGFTWVPYCWDWMQNFEKIVVFGDFEKNQITLFKEIAARWEGKVWHVNEKDYKDCKDANDILRKYGKDQIKQCINGAVQNPIQEVIDLSSVEDINPYDIPKVATGIKYLDDLLCGGLPLGQMILLTGKSGDGKSTLASQILVNALEQGYKIFAYSGELPNYIFKSWISFQAAGDKNVIQNKGKWGMYTNINNETKAKLDAWYENRFWIYDNRTQAVAIEETTGLIKLIENVIQQYGVRVLLLDNLMTALDMEGNRGEDKYERQSLFVKMLIRIALQYNVLILLVAHKRKTYGNEPINDSVSGSLDIVNLASIVLSYERPSNKRRENDTNITAEDRILKITKNRLFGRTDNHGSVLHYEPLSKRIYISDKERNRKYGWVEYENVDMQIEDFPF
jgi:KaiC/GvpD/RAD55 family RecA-like ATPase